MSGARPSVEIHVFEERFADQVRALVLDIQREEFGVSITAEEQPDLMDTSGFFQSDEGNFWVARAEGQVVGTIGLKDFGARRLALRKMFVDASWRGAAKGVSGLLMDAALKWARKKGARAIYLGSVAQMHAAHRFYEKHGFEAVADSALPDDFPLAHVDTKFFRLTL
ncbi:MAG: GNAT family N-acetyltransferase [Hyphomicrobiales bacterium]|nr:GNAT family N-acetyltransferase [Hyphomicrobiales bacterium]